MTTDTARVHLDIYGQPRVVELEVRVGAAKLDDLFAPGAELVRQVSGLAVARAEGEGKRVTCGPACGACCRQVVPISVIEAGRLARHVAALPEPERVAVEARFADAVRRLGEAGLLAAGAPPGRATLVAGAKGTARAMWLDVSRRYFALQIACPFLVDESCSVYPDRPMVCREYLVTSDPARCASLDGGSDVVDRPLHVGEAFAEVARQLAGAPPAQIPLTLALEWVAAHGAVLDRELDGEAMFHAWMAAAQEPEGPPNKRRNKKKSLAKKRRR